MIKIVCIILLVIGLCSSYNISIVNTTNEVAVTSADGIIEPQFTAVKTPVSCIMPKLYIYNDTSHESYMVLTEGVRVADVVGRYRKVEWSIDCKHNDGNELKCATLVNSGCG